MKVIKEKFTLLAMLTALSVVLALTFIIPVPLTKGYVNFLEVGIYVSAMLLGGPAGMIVGGISGGMLDLLLGYPQWMVFSILIHGGQGFIAGKMAKNSSLKQRLLALLVASIVMITGYFGATWLLYGLAAGILSIMGNIFQTAFGMLVSLVLMRALDKIDKFK